MSADRPARDRRAYAAAYRAAHREQVRAGHAIYEAAHRDEIAAYRAAHRDERRAYDLAWRQDHRERSNGHGRAYRIAHPEKVRDLAAQRRGAGRCGHAACLVIGATQLAWMAHGHVCYLCGAQLWSSAWMDHVLPIVAGGLHCADNLRPACAPCNRHKGASTLMDAP